MTKGSEFGLLYDIAAPEKRARVWGLLFLLGLLHALILTGALALGIITLYLPVCLIAINIAIERYYKKIPEKDGEYLKSPFSDHAYISFFVFLLPNILIFALIFKAGGNGFVHTLLQKNTFILDKAIELHFFYRLKEFSWAWPVEILRRLFSFAYFAYSDIIFALTCWPSASRLSKLWVRCFKMFGGPLTYLVICLMLFIMCFAMAYCMPVFHQVLDRHSLTYFYLEHFSYLVIAWGIVLPLSTVWLLSAIIGCFRYYGARVFGSEAGL